MLENYHVQYHENIVNSREVGVKTKRETDVFSWFLSTEVN